MAEKESKRVMEEEKKERARHKGGREGGGEGRERW